jgi:hypothetical protein
MKTLLTNLIGRSSLHSRPHGARKNSSQFRIEGLERRDCQTGLTVGTLAAALHQQLSSDVNQFIRDSLTAEFRAPTLAGRAIVNDVARIALDARVSTVGHVFADFNILATDLASEAAIVATYRLPKSWSLLSSSTIVTDLHHVAYDENAFIALNNYVTRLATYEFGQTSTAGSNTAWRYVNSGLSQLTNAVSMPYDTNPTSLGAYPNATGMGLAFSTGVSGAILSQGFNTVFGAGSGTSTATLVDSGMLTGTQINAALGSYLPSNFMSNFLSNTGLGGLISAGMTGH